MIKIVCVGKIKEKYIKETINDYYNRIKKYTNIEIVEVPDDKIDDELVVKRKEAERILSQIKEKEYVVLLDVKGIEYNSEEYAKFINDTFIHASNITFVIGGSLGFDETIYKRANKRISFSKMTFPHQLIRIFLLEQIYRGFKISNNESYHK